MHRISIWSALLLAVCVALGSPALGHAKCIPELLKDVKYVPGADSITLIPPRFTPEEECVLKGQYWYVASYAKEGEGPIPWIPVRIEGPVVIQHLTPSTTYNIKIAMRYIYTSLTSRKQVEETPEFPIEAKTIALAVPPPPTKEIKLMDSSHLNKTQQEFEIPSDIFSNVNGALKKIYALVAQDTEIDKCEEPVTWRIAHSHSPIKCYKAGAENELHLPCQFKDDSALTCVLGSQEGCDGDMCNGPLTPGVKYGVKLRAINEAGSTDSKPAFFTAGSPPGAAGSGRTVSGSSSLIGGITFFAVLAMTK
ncbi:uncharacterized protein LOC135401521 [Ornithodoros turicata]|uniref:uncharacterized protein LOC135401521 n=1 Tax=Ornithodoros turicata TaxID=34597 RepID=UPI00313A3497